VAECFAKQKFDLPIEAAEVVVRPAAHRVEDLRINA